MAVVIGKAYLAIAELARFLPNDLGHILAGRGPRRLQIAAGPHPFHNGFHLMLMFFGKRGVFG